MKKNIVLAMVSLLILVTISFAAPEKDVNEAIFFADRNIPIEIADSSSERQKGLSDRYSIGEGIEGLLFVFDNPDLHGIWMKDMNFAIDIIWFNEMREIIHWEKQVTPDSYPSVFRPNSNSLYVLELNAGFVDDNNLKMGDSFEFLK
jgi:uncharacterized protein